MERIFRERKLADESERADFADAEAEPMRKTPTGALVRVAAR
jgi:hypothetical protein